MAHNGDISVQSHTSLLNSFCQYQNSCGIMCHSGSSRTYEVCGMRGVILYHAPLSGLSWFCSGSRGPAGPTQDPCPCLHHKSSGMTHHSDRVHVNIQITARVTEPLLSDVKHLCNKISGFRMRTHSKTCRRSRLIQHHLVRATQSSIW